MKVKSLSRVRLLATPWTAAYQAPPSMGFSRQEYWSGVPLPSPIDIHTMKYNPAIKGTNYGFVDLFSNLDGLQENDPEGKKANIKILHIV